MKLNIYIYTTIRTIRKSGGVGGYLMEAMAGNEPATAQKFMQQADMNFNAATLSLLASALQHVIRPCEIEIYVDNSYVGNAIEKRWVDKWENDNWKNAKGKDIADVDSWKTIWDVLKKFCENPVIHISEKHSYSSWMESTARDKEVKDV